MTALFTNAETAFDNKISGTADIKKLFCALTRLHLPQASQLTARRLFKKEQTENVSTISNQFNDPSSPNMSPSVRGLNSTKDDRTSANITCSSPATCSSSTLLGNSAALSLSFSPPHTDCKVSKLLISREQLTL